MTAAIAAGLSRKLFQVAYVTNDFDCALLEFGSRLAVPKFFEIRALPMETAPGETAQIHVGLAWSGGVQIEIIQPLGGSDAVYRDWLPAGRDYALRFHHLAHLMESEAEFDAVAAQLARQGVPVPLRGANPGAARYLYGDFRATLGHYVEYIHFTATGRQFFEKIPHAG